SDGPTAPESGLNPARFSRILHLPVRVSVDPDSDRVTLGSGRAGSCAPMGCRHRVVLRPRSRSAPRHSFQCPQPQREAIVMRHKLCVGFVAAIAVALTAGLAFAGQRYASVGVSPEAAPFTLTDK